MSSFVSVVDDSGEEVDLPIEGDGTILLSVLHSQFQDASGLKYRNPATDRWVAVRLTEGKLHPPIADHKGKKSWRTSLYTVVGPRVRDQERYTRTPLSSPGTQRNDHISTQPDSQTPRSCDPSPAPDGESTSIPEPATSMRQENDRRSRDSSPNPPVSRGRSPAPRRSRSRSPFRWFSRSRDPSPEPGRGREGSPKPKGAGGSSPGPQRSRSRSPLRRSRDPSPEPSAQPDSSPEPATRSRDSSPAPQKSQDPSPAPQVNGGGSPLSTPAGRQAETRLSADRQGDSQPELLLSLGTVARTLEGQLENIDGDRSPLLAHRRALVDEARRTVAQEMVMDRLRGSVDDLKLAQQTENVRVSSENLFHKTQSTTFGRRRRRRRCMIS